MSRVLVLNAKALLGTWPLGTTRVNGARMPQLPQLENAWLFAENGRITAIGQHATEAPPEPTPETRIVHAEGRFVLPGFCDSHTHTVFAATREGEWEDRLRGLTYQQIAARGGGIMSSAHALRAASEEDLFQQALTRIQELMRMGTVALEIKTGYGLNTEAELKMLRVIHRLRRTLPLEIKATLLAAHAVPTEYKEDRAAYMRMILHELLPRAVEEGLADFLDVFCETGYFTVKDMEDLLSAAARYGLKGKVHVNQFTSLGGVASAVRHHALSVDHLEIMTEQDLRALRGTDTIPTLLPGCSFFLGIPYAPARRLLEADHAVALASDFNPGSAPSGNMVHTMALACTQMKMLPTEALTAATQNGAAAMDLGKQLGSLTVGKHASFIITRPLPSPAAIPYFFGSDVIDTVFIHGDIVRSGSAIA
jgi:imidazolonepropionase